MRSRRSTIIDVMLDENWYCRLQQLSIFVKVAVPYSATLSLCKRVCALASVPEASSPCIAAHGRRDAEAEQGVHECARPHGQDSECVSVCKHACGLIVPTCPWMLSLCRGRIEAPPKNTLAIARICQLWPAAVEGTDSHHRLRRRCRGRRFYPARVAWS